MITRILSAASSALFLGFIVFSAAALADDPGTKTAKSSSDQRFAVEAAQGGMAEVQLGQLAKDKASNDAVKKFGQRMIDDHTKANDQLKSVASESGITLPTDVSAKDKAEMDRLSKLSGDAFDRAYMQMMVKDHKKDVAEFQKEANNGKDEKIKKFASDTLPTLQSHLQMAQDTAAKIGSQSAHR